MKHETIDKLFVNIGAVNGLTKRHDTNQYELLPVPERNELPELLLISSYPPRECGIATYTQDLIKSLKEKFSHSFRISICALESKSEQYHYKEPVKYRLNTDEKETFAPLSKTINHNDAIGLVLIQHEFGFFENSKCEFRQFLKDVSKPVLIVFHTVLPKPGAELITEITGIAEQAKGIIVMTKNSAKLLTEQYGIEESKISIIPHGTHLVKHLDKNELKKQYGYAGRSVLSTFGLLSSGKSIETTLDALPAIVDRNPEALFLILGKTHPNIVKNEGETYRQMLEEKVRALKLMDHVVFINRYLSLEELLDYLQLTDIYLFTSKDPNQAVSGTFSYAMSCGCPIVSTPIPHAMEILQNGAGITIDFENSSQLSDAVIKLLNDDELRKNFSLNALHSMSVTAWENSAVAHALLFEQMSSKPIGLHYRIPRINLNHLKSMTTEFGIIQFSKIDQPDISSGYTLDDNARALISFCAHFSLTCDQEDLIYIKKYLNFIHYCLQADGTLLNYVDENRNFTDQNCSTNLEDATGRAIWALGYLISLSDLFSDDLKIQADHILQRALKNCSSIHSTRAMAFIIKGLYYRNTRFNLVEDHFIIRELANRLVQMYRHETDHKWQWFEHYLTYANSILPEALLCAWMATGKPVYKEIAKSSFDFLISKIFTGESIRVVSNNGWMQKHEEQPSGNKGGEQPIDVAYTIIALNKFYDVFKEEAYLNRIEQSFDWFLGNNHLNQIIYNPCTGGCYDGLEANYVNLNQGAESSLSYLMARLTMASFQIKQQKQINRIQLSA